MDAAPGRQGLDRHALVMTIWLSLGFAAAVLLHLGLTQGRTLVILGAFGLLVVAFLGHVVVNAVSGTRFGTRELALGLVLYGAALLGFGLAILLWPGFAARAFLPVSGGFGLLLLVLVFYMVTHFGVRGAFEGFDVIRTFRAGASERRTRRTEP